MPDVSELETHLTPRTVGGNADYQPDAVGRISFARDLDAPARKFSVLRSAPDGNGIFIKVRYIGIINIQRRNIKGLELRTLDKFAARRIA